MPFTGFLGLSRHKPPHRQAHGGDAPDDSRRPRRRSAAGGWAAEASNDGRRHTCNGTHSRDSPSDSSGTQPSDSSRRRPCCGPPAAAPRSAALSVATRQGRAVHPPCRGSSDHAPECTSMCSSGARAVSVSRTSPRSRRLSRSPLPRSTRWCARCWPSRSLSQQSLSYHHPVVFTVQRYDKSRAVQNKFTYFSVAMPTNKPSPPAGPSVPSEAPRLMSRKSA